MFKGNLHMGSSCFNPGDMILSFHCGESRLSNRMDFTVDTLTFPDYFGFSLTSQRWCQILT